MRKILIVEDDEPQQILYETELTELGYQVIIAGNGEDAITQVKHHQPDLIILDLMIPGKHGLEALREFLSINPNIPVIIHTAYSHYKDDFMSWAAEEYVVKSSDLTELKKAIQRVLSRKVQES